MSLTVETLCGIVQRAFHARQRVINTMSTQITAEDLMVALRQGDTEARRWGYTVLCFARDHLIHGAAPQPTELGPIGVDVMQRLVSELPPATPVYTDAAGVSWTAGAVAASVETDAALAHGYAQALAQVLLDGLIAQARKSPRMKTGSLMYGAHLDKMGWIPYVAEVSRRAA